MLDAQNDMPMNTQEPDAEFAGAYRVGQATNSLCFEEAAGLPPGFPLLDKEYHTFYAYASPVLVEYDFLPNGKPRIHPERGLGFDVQLDDTTHPVLHWYLATHVNPSDVPDPEQAIVPVPNVVVRGTMRDGDAISIGDSAYRDGNVIMDGQSLPVTLAGEATQGAEHAVMNGMHVYHIQVPLELYEPLIPRATGYNFQVEVFVENPYCSEEGDYLMPNVVDQFTADGFRPRLELGVRNPVRLEFIHPRIVDDDLEVSAVVGSPWGNYDIVLAEMAVVQDNERIAVAPAAIDSQTQCHCYGEPVPASWVLENITSLLDDGGFTLEFTVETLQGHRETFTVEMAGEEARAMPGLGTAGITVVLLAVGLLLGRRDK
jgi:hypothetical protein